MPLNHYSEYMQWYLRRTRRYISRDGAHSDAMYTFAKRICDQSRPPASLINPTQSLYDVFSSGHEMMGALAELYPNAYSTHIDDAPPTYHYDIPETNSPQQTPVDSHYQGHTSSFTQQQQQQQQYGFSNYDSPYNYFSSSSQNPIPTMFATSSTTPFSAYDPQQYYRPTMPPTNIFGMQHTDDEVVVEDVDEDEDDSNEEEPQLVTRGRARISQRNEQQLRVQPPRRRKPPPCGTSSHRRH
ncbi:PREDICTED: uncharacterized protein LOC109347207 [Lupinus angustifolius]|uniref:uncharacterized protein LOC109347207 n=1 Tax=Lupinus angustifolius TaxID=3871 RepID=UPI00092FAD64|nr:PREDICTED: uncharacterized protein LOC109347207 [Lupinus angustifolius]